jgi:hypothetical protein
MPAAVRFLSVEPMVEPVDVAPWLMLPSRDGRPPIFGSWLEASQAAALARCIPIGSAASATRCASLAPSYSSSRSAAITCSGQVSAGRGKIRHNGRPCGYRNSRMKSFAHRAALAGDQNGRVRWHDESLHG